MTKGNVDTLSNEKGRILVSPQSARLPGTEMTACIGYQ